MIISINLVAFIQGIMGDWQLWWIWRRGHEILFIYNKGFFKILDLYLTVYYLEQIVPHHFHKIILVTFLNKVSDIPIFAQVFSCFAAKFFQFNVVYVTILQK